MKQTLSHQWQHEFLRAVQQCHRADQLRDVASLGNLGDWTRVLTAVVADSCASMGWTATALNHQADLLPVARSEYLALDVMAFSRDDSASRWRFPVAVMELENRQDEDYIAYTLWKLLCVRADLRVLFCYRSQANEARHLIAFLADKVVAAMSIDQRVTLTGVTLVVVGSRGDADAFPYGFFKWWRLEVNTGRFQLF